MANFSAVQRSYIRGARRMKAFEEYKTKLTLKKMAKIWSAGGDCLHCPAAKVCRSLSKTDCETAFIKWGNMEVTE